mgnify:CR=1 FL=1
MVTREMAQLTRPEDYLAGGLDTRNYGELAGIPEARALFAEILGCRAEQVFVGGNASLQLMYDTISKAYTHGLLHSERPWCREPVVKFLCPAPGYDRHFKVTESFGFELVTIPMTDEGPDMDAVEKAIQDPAVKGMWNVPKYSNPDGIIYSAETIRRIASMKPAAPDFMLMWDNAYCIHELEGEFVPFPDILSLCRQAGNGDMVYEFASTSKITFPGAGVAVMACSEANMAHMLSLIGVQTIGYDKINQLRHVRYLKDRSHTLALMQRHAAVLAPKFRAVLTALEQLAPLEVPAPAAVTLENLSFSYGEGPIFSGLSLTAHPGDIIGITGPVACGKSTFGRVFLCEAPYQGSVCFGGRELSALPPRQIAATVGYLGHDPELSADTVQNNVLCGSEQDAMPWLAAAALKEEVLAMEKGTETVIGRGGTRLSGGQAQRLALARTLAHPRPVLILDDPFSALDRDTEDTVFADLQEYARDRVVFLISHRLYHFPQMQKIVFMDGGKTTVGTHEELMASAPVYRQLYESQTGGKQHGEQA